jgi:hypothetical protein
MHLRHPIQIGYFDQSVCTVHSEYKHYLIRAQKLVFAKNLHRDQVDQYL